MKIKSIKAIRVKLPDSPNTTKSRRASWNKSARRAMPVNFYPEFSRRPDQMPGGDLKTVWVQAVAEDGSFKSADDLLAIYGGKGIDGGKETIAYCRIGERSSHTWFVLTQLLGHSNVRNYDGSWTEWGSIVGAPIER